MKKWIAILGCLTLVLGLCACSKKPTEPIEGEQPQIQVARFDCHEYDLETNQFTDNILLALNLTSDFESTDKSVLLIQDNKYYIGEFKRKDAEGNVNKTVSVFELTDDSFSIAHECSRVSDSWTISNASLNDDPDSYMRVFYTEIGKYTIGMSIVNTSKEPLSIDDALQNLAFMVNEECTAPLPIEDQSVIVEGSLESPARMGEWVSTMVYNPVVDDYEPICVCITEVETGYLADKVIKDYNNSLGWKRTSEKVSLQHDRDCCWAVYRYSVFFPSSFTTNSSGKIDADIQIPITFCNIKDDGAGINGYLNLQSSLRDISPEMVNIKAGTIWSSGEGWYEIPKTANYLLKITPSVNSENTKYFKP